MTKNDYRLPLQVMRAITDTAGCACVYLLTATGGVVQGDRYHLHIVVEENAHALITTLAATKIYRMPDGCAEQTIHIEVQQGATLEFVPDAAILFAHANYHQTIHITLAEGAVVLFQDGVMGGRLASGEALQFTRYRNHITVTDPQGLLLYEPQDIVPSKQALASVGILEHYTSWAGWYLLGDLSRLQLDAATFCAEYAPPVDLLGAASRLHRNGVAVRLLGGYWSPIGAELDRLRGIIRQDYMQLPATMLRK